MKTSLLKKGFGVTVALCAAASAVALAPAADAAVYPSVSNVVVTAGGSDTTQNFMTQYLSRYNNSTTIVPGKTLRTYNIPAIPVAAGFTTFGDDANCIQDVTWKAPGAVTPPATQLAPSGSGAGLTYLATQRGAADGQKGCIDIGRSSGGPTSTNGGLSTRYTSSQEFYAFAMDAVSWASPSLKAPANLTPAQVKAIYTCNIVDWGQLPGGTPGPIQRYLPQAGSGTRTFFLEQFQITSIAAGDPAGPCKPVKDASVANPKGGSNIPFEENQGKSIEPVDIDKAILPYSAGVWSYQAGQVNNPSLDLRNGVRMGGLTPTGVGVAAGNPIEWNTIDGAYALNNSPDGVVAEANIAQANTTFSLDTQYVGIRYVYNVVDNTTDSAAQDLAGYTAALKLVGFNNGGSEKSPLCSNSPSGNADQKAARNKILEFGFAPLDNVGNPKSSNLVGATCRFFTNPS